MDVWKKDRQRKWDREGKLKENWTSNCKQNKNSLSWWKATLWKNGSKEGSRCQDGPWKPEG